MNKWIVRISETLIDNNWVKVRKDHVLLPNSEKIEDFHVVSFHEVVAIVTFDCDGILFLQSNIGILTAEI